ncbi:MAG: hypothetical protein ACK4UO_13040 [Pseudolabrys sp.]
MQKRGTKPTVTRLQERAIEALKKNIIAGNPKSFKEVLREAGYTPETARQYSNIMAGLKPHLQPTLDWMVLHRDRIQTEMENKIGRADYADLARSFKIVTEAMQLLGGKPTAIVQLPAEHRARLDALLDQ